MQQKRALPDIPVSAHGGNLPFQGIVKGCSNFLVIVSSPFNESLEVSLYNLLCLYSIFRKRSAKINSQQYIGFSSSTFQLSNEMNWNDLLWLLPVCLLWNSFWFEILSDSPETSFFKVLLVAIWSGFIKGFLWRPRMLRKNKWWKLTISTDRPPIIVCNFAINCL